MSTFRQVDLPAPFGPMSAWIVPGSTVNETSSSAVIPPKRTVRPSATSGSALARGAAAAGRAALGRGLGVASPDPPR